MATEWDIAHHLNLEFAQLIERVVALPSVTSAQFEKTISVGQREITYRVTIDRSTFESIGLALSPPEPRSDA